MKFGGTSMAGTERIRRVANIVRAQAAKGDQVAVVVSAMAGETDRLVNFCREANPLYDPAEYDVVVASGEQVTSGLLALTLQASYKGAQLARLAIADLDNRSPRQGAHRYDRCTRPH
jgi:Aspartokinases